MSRLLSIICGQLFNRKGFPNVRRRISDKTMDVKKLRKDARMIFESGVNSVKPNNLISSSIKIQGTTLLINGNSHQLPQKVYVVGFGKAVAGMASALQKVLADKITAGIISVPIGTSKISKTEKHQVTVPHAGARIKLLEGARNNLPDEDSLKATREIVKLVSKLDKDDLLIVLISGGGSALLPSPKPPLSLAEKTEVIKLLSYNGATIQDLNCVRKRLSFVKGGGLAQLAYPSKVISLILSDIIGDPLDLIASSPTVENKDDPEEPARILKKFLKPQNVSPNITSCLQNTHPETQNRFDHVTNYLIGTNRKALQLAKTCAENIGYVTIILTDTLKGEASVIGRCFANLAKEILNVGHGDTISTENCQYFSNLLGTQSINIIETVKNIIRRKKAVCVLSGGETTVVVKGNGIGGRNQEMSLSFAIESEHLLNNPIEHSILFLSAGTDGIDGPTDAAGALAYPTLASEARSAKIDPKAFLLNNDSYSFYKAFRNGKDHVVVGHTGTNVMDIQILLIHPKLQ